MQPYSERSAQLVCAASVVVLVLSNRQGANLEFLPLIPRQMPDGELAELQARWPGRGMSAALEKQNDVLVKPINNAVRRMNRWVLQRRRE